MKDLWCDTVPLTSCVAESKLLCLPELSVSISRTGTTISVSQAIVKSGGRGCSSGCPLLSKHQGIRRKC